MWKKRVHLAKEKGMSDLAEEARERVRSLVTDVKEAAVKLETLQHEKEMLRKDARRPTGEEVARSEAMLERLRQSGIVDPDEAALEREFDEMASEQALRELRRSGEDQVDVEALREMKREAIAEESAAEESDNGS